MSLYDDLGVPKDASQEAIKKAYRSKARKHHPDRAGGNTEKMAQANRAYMVLSDPEKRQRYDNGESPEKTGQTPEDIARTVVGQTLVQALRTTTIDKNMLKAAQDLLFESIVTEENNEKQTKDVLAYIDKRAKRLRKRKTKKEGPDMIKALLETERHNLKSSLEVIKSKKHVLQLARKMLEDYEEDPPSPEDAVPPKPKTVMDALDILNTLNKRGMGL